MIYYIYRSFFMRTLHKNCLKTILNNVTLFDLRFNEFFLLYAIINGKKGNFGIELYKIL